MNEVEYQPLATNVIPNGDFDLYNENNEPLYMDEYGSGYRNYTVNYDGDQNSGLYSHKIELQGHQFSASSSFSRYLGSISPSITLDEDIDITFSVKLSYPSINFGQTYLRVELYNQVESSYHTIYDYLSYSSLSSSSSNYVYIGNNVTLDTWTTISLDVTQIFIDNFGGSTLANERLTNIQFYANSYQNAPEITTILFDDITVSNSSAYNYTPEGDFESSYTTWNYGGITEPSYIKVDHPNGETILNMTNKVTDTDSTSNSGISDYNYNYYDMYFMEENMGTLSFDYKYDNTSYGGNQYSYFYIGFRNDTFEFYTYYYLARVNYGLSGNSSSSGYRQVTFDYSGKYNSWEHFEIDLYQLLEEYNMSNLGLYYAELYSYTYGAINESSSLYIDNYQLISNPIQDSSFEENWMSTKTNPLLTWRRSGSYPNYNISDDSHSGSTGLRISLDASSSTYLYKNILLNIEKNYFTDFWTKLTSSNFESYSYAYIRLYLNDSHSVYYVSGYDPTYTYTNSSTVAYYLISEANQENIWINIRRNVYNDLTEAFGIYESLNRIYIGGDTSAAGSFTSLFDDINFIEDRDGPSISGVNIRATTNYNDVVEVEFMINDDLSETLNASLYYHNGISWNSVLAVREGLYYVAFIPEQKYNTVVSYYIKAFDIHGNFAIDDNSGSNYQFVVGDNISPIIELVTPYNHTVVTGNITILANSYDAGSNISLVEYYFDGLLLDYTVSSPFTKILNTREYDNGTHEIFAIAYDSENNTAVSDKIIIEINNDKSAPIISDILINPRSPTSGANISLYVSIEDASEIIRVSLFTKINDGSWIESPMEKFGNLYSYNLDPIFEGNSLYYYIVAEDEFANSVSKGSSLSPFSYSLDPLVPLDTDSGSNDTQNLIEELIEQATELFNDNQFYFGMGSVVSLAIVYQILKFSIKRKKAKK
ncbi:MAG: hypothetical protein INQ03_20165 [Candidatus Heimdallarchaeota archaeon]|nr:hypothetical protein [Candidatus Heimdallarchaeota archaeon]